MTHEPTDEALSLRVRTTQTRALRGLDSARQSVQHLLTQQADALRAVDRHDDALMIEESAAKLGLAFSEAVSASRTWGKRNADN